MIASVKWSGCAVCANVKVVHLQTAAQAQHQVQRGLLLDVVVGHCAPVLQLLACKDQALLIRRDSLLVLNLLLHIPRRGRRIHVQRDGLSRQRLDKTAHGNERRVPLGFVNGLLRALTSAS